jgi:hypothetical protein
MAAASITGYAQALLKLLALNVGHEASICL